MVHHKVDFILNVFSNFDTVYNATSKISIYDSNVHYSQGNNAPWSGSMSPSWSSMRRWSRSGPRPRFGSWPRSWSSLFLFLFGIFFWRRFFGLWYRLRLGSFQDVTCRGGLLYWGVLHPHGWLWELWRFLLLFWGRERAPALGSVMGRSRVTVLSLSPDRGRSSSRGRRSGSASSWAARPLPLLSAAFLFFLIPLIFIFILFFQRRQFFLFNLQAQSWALRASIKVLTRVLQLPFHRRDWLQGVPCSQVHSYNTLSFILYH